MPLPVRERAVQHRDLIPEPSGKYLHHLRGQRNLRHEDDGVPACVQGLCDGMDAMEVFTRLDRVRKIREKEIVTVTVDHELEDVVEIFSRLNSRGTRVTEADIYLGVVAARNPTWVRDTFLPYLMTLEAAGFDLNPNLLFRTITAVGEGKTRFKEIPDPEPAEELVTFVVPQDQ